MKLCWWLLFAVFIFTSACSSGTPKVTQWYSCKGYEEYPIVGSFTSKGKEYQVVQCELPKLSNLRKGEADFKDMTIWKIEEGRECGFRHGYNSGIGSMKTNEPRPKYLYGAVLKSRPISEQNINCSYLGFLPEKDQKLPYAKFLAQKPEFTEQWNHKYFLFEPTSDKGIMKHKGFFKASFMGHSMLNGYEQGWRIGLYDQNQNLQKEWKGVQEQVFSFETEFGSGIEKKLIFKIGESYAFVDSNWKSLQYDRYYKKDVPRLIPLTRREKSFLPQKGEVRNLHLYNPKTKRERTLSSSQFRVQGILNDQGKPFWYILKPVDPKRDLYAVMDQDGNASLPNGALGIRPITMNLLIQNHSSFTRSKVPTFWLIAYADKSNGVLWGEASGDFSNFGEPKWRDIRQMKEGWLFLQRADNKKWQFVDGYNTGLSSKQFSTPELAYAEVEKVFDQRAKLAEAERKRKEAEWRAFNQRNHESNLKQYYEALSNGETEKANKIARRDTILFSRHVLSGRGTQEDLLKLAQNGKGSDKNKAKAILDHQKRLEEARIERERQLAEQRQRQAVLDRWARKREELNSWRSMVNKNITNTNRAVQQSWSKHQTEMYKKGYIDFPK